MLLVVENDGGFARFLLEAAREKGFKTLVTALGASALTLAREYNPDALTLGAGDAQHDQEADGAGDVGQQQPDEPVTHPPPDRSGVVRANGLGSRNRVGHGAGSLSARARAAQNGALLAKTSCHPSVPFAISIRRTVARGA